MVTPHCAICGTTEQLSWCSTCKVWLCSRCQRNYPARGIAALVTWWQRLVGKA